MSQDNGNKPAPRANHGLRLVKTAPAPEPVKTPSSAGKDNSLVKQLSALADAIDADIAMILNF